MKPVLSTVEPLIEECPHCQAGLELPVKRGNETEAQKRTERRMRVLAAKGCPVCFGSGSVATASGRRVLDALLPLIETAVHREVSNQLRAMGFAVPTYPTPTAQIVATGGEGG